MQYFYLRCTLDLISTITLAFVSEKKDCLGQNRTTMAGWLPVQEPTWKLFYEPYHTSLHGKTCFTVISALSMHPGAGGVQNMAIFGSKYTYYGRVVPGRWVPPGKCLMCHITSHYMAKHVSGPFVPSLILSHNAPLWHWSGPK